MRKDLAIIADFITAESKILDIGCNEGQLLEHLVQTKNVNAQGIEISQQGVSICVKKGLSVIQGDADTDLVHYPNNGFDVAIMSRALQATHNPRDVLIEMGRIAKKVIVSLPNFGYWYNRYYLTVHGRMPVSKTLSYEWYETPNIHFSTIKDFKILVEELGCHIAQERYIMTNDRLLPGWANAGANLLAEYVVFVIET